MQRGTHSELNGVYFYKVRVSSIKQRGVFKMKMLERRNEIIMLEILNTKLK